MTIPTRINGDEINASWFNDIKDDLEIVSRSLETYVDDAAYVTAKASSATEGDIYGNETDNSIHYYNGTSWEVLEDAKNNFTATSAPATNDDSGDGYVVGSKWIDVSSDDFYICVDSTASAAVWKSLITEASDIAYIKDIKNEGTGGGSASATTMHTRDITVINTNGGLTSNTVSFMTLSSNQLTIDAGTYQIKVRCPAYRVDGHQTQLYNVTDAAIELEGSSAYNYTVDSVQTYSIVAGEFTISSSKVFEIRHWTAGANASVGLGVGIANGSNNTNTKELFTSGWIKKIS